HFQLTDVSGGGKAPDTLEGALDRCAEQQLITRLDRLAEAGLVDTDEVEARLLVRRHPRADEGENARGLRQRLDDDDAGHDRPAREVTQKERLVERDVLQGTDALAGLALQ